jgi:hypothetical protein
MKKHLLYFLLISLSLYAACNNDNSANPLDDNANGSSGKAGFGVSGLLFENNLVMWDREHQGSRSEFFPQMYFTRADAANFPTWGSFPSGQMVSGGVPRDGIPALTNPKFVEPASSEAGYVRNTDIVLGAVINGEAKAYPFSKLSGKPVVNDQINGRDVVIVSELSAKLAIPYDRSVNGQLLNFTLSSTNSFQMTDNETNSVWNIKGEAVSGSLAGAKLKQIPAYNAFWFAWSVFWPSTQIFD